ncbi:nucleotidyltransferase domain-containing protein [Streptomyces bohaiensis]|uniref:Nucleotidyltransferase domain-containing protein n=1 Tax=Streptomyces bohaiensis TaxID=1431344 RepID=A0ABX1CFQ5_9ACTN|nr:nucleotidyltransferase domain-containing protein [Streptomyces bohaiensis]NJQ16670.1 nucleotidyltransferase domain-containing protein [Streptomyces bohaiensis]
MTAASYLTGPALDAGFLDRLPELVSALSPRFAGLPEAGRTWVVHGSAPLGRARPGSDIDVLLLLPGPAGTPTPHRRTLRWGTTGVTVHVLTSGDLSDDGAARRFGGYFSLRLFTPFVADGAIPAPALATATARFLGPLARAVTVRGVPGPWNSDQMLAHGYLALLDLYPDYAGHLAASTADRDRWRALWAHQRDVYVAALLRTGHVAPVEGGRWRYTGLSPVTDPLRERARCAARFWALGAACHGAGAGFPDAYFRSVDERATRREQAAAVFLVHDIAASGRCP